MNAGERTEGRFAQRGAFEAPAVRATAVGTDAVALGTDDGVVVADSRDRRTVAQGESVTDVALSDRVYALTEAGLTAYSQAGSRVWRVDDLGAAAVHVDPATTRVVVRTEDAALAVLDGETGVERRRFEQPHSDVTADPAVVAAEPFIVVAAWSFVSVVDWNGEVLADETLDGAIDAVGVVDDVVVTALRDGRTVALGSDGDRRWSTDVAVDWLAPRGSRELLCHADSDIFALGVEGDTVDVGGLDPGDRIVVSADGGVACRVTEETVSVFSRTVDATDEVGVAVDVNEVDESTGAIPMTVSNEAPTSVDATIEVTAEGATLSTTRLDATLGPEESTTRRVGVRSIRADAEAVTVTVREPDDERSVTLPVVENETALVSEATATAVDHGAVDVDVTVENAGEAPLSEVTVDGTVLGGLPPGETETVGLSRSLPTGEVAVDAAEVDRRTVALDYPVTPTEIRVDAAADGFVDVHLSNGVPAAAVDTVAVEGVPADGERVERELTLPADGAAVLAVPTTAAGEREVVVDTAAGTLSQSVAVSEPTVEPPTEPRRDAGPPTPDSTTSATSANSTDSADSFGSASVPTNEDESASSLSVVRELSTERAVRGHVFEETVRVTNESDDPVRATLWTDDGEFETTVGIQPDDSTGATRRHVSYDDEVDIPQFTAEARPVSDRGAESETEAETATPTETASARGRTLPVTENPLTPYARLLAGDDGNELTVVLDGSDPQLSVAHATVGETAERVTVDERIDDVRLVERELTQSPDVETATVELQVDGPDGSRTVRTLAPRHEVDRWAESAPLSELTVAAGAASRIEGDTGFLEVELTNDGDRSLTGLETLATGEAVDDFLYDGYQFETVEPGETVTDDVDLVDVDGDVTVGLDLEVRGPEPDSGSVSFHGTDRGEEYDWELRRDDDGGPPPVNDRLSTGFR
ncbi:MAG: hypothetical protein ABEJ79_06510 [Halolamina sp.]